MRKLQLWMLVILICGACLQTSCSQVDNAALSEKEQFEYEMTAALADARIYGPPTQTLAQKVAERYGGRVTELNYKSRESATRKCITDNSRPYELKDLARTTIAAGWDSIEIKPVISSLVEAAHDWGLSTRHKHQTSDYGYWGDLVNLKFERLSTEVQVKTYPMFYATNPGYVVLSVLGDSIYTVIRSKSKVEPGLFHHYYEIIRADTSSEATVEHYKRLSKEYHACFEHIRD